MGYQIPFKSLHDTDYLLLINGGGTIIDGGADTFNTSEDADTDFFKPVRTQSGTFSFVSNDRSVWLAMVPQNALSIPVQLTTGGAIKWQGYIQPQVYHHDYPDAGAMDTHEFSVQCPLSVLDTVDPIFPDLGTTPVVTIGQLLQTYIFGRLTGTTISGYYIQGTSAATLDRLRMKVMLQNFVEVDSTGVLRPRYNCMQILEAICKFFGYTCRMHGEYVYFTMPVTKANHIDVGFTQYGDLTSSGSYSARGSVNITNAMFCNTNDHEEILPGIGKVAVRSDINKLDNLVEIPYDELYDQYNLGSSTTIVRSVDYYEHAVYNLVRQPNGNGLSLNYENDTVDLSVHMDSVPGTTHDSGNGKIYGRFFVYDDQDVGAVGGGVPESKENYSWRKCIELFHSYNVRSSSPAGAMFAISSKQAFVVSDGMLYINFRCHQVSAWPVGKVTIPGSSEKYPAAKCSLRIGNRYWNGSEWALDSFSSFFYLPFTSEGAKTNRSEHGGISAPQYQGFGIPVNSSVIPVDGSTGIDTLRGIVEFQVLDVLCFQALDSSFIPQGADINGFLPLMDFEIGFVRGVIEETKHQGNEYVVKGVSNSFREEYNVDLIFASDVEYGPTGYKRRMPAGLGYLLDYTTEKPIENIPSVDGTTNVIAEQELAQIIAQYGDHTHRLVVIDVFTNLVGPVDPTVMSAGLESDMFPLAISHNWRDDITTLTLIEL